MIAFSENPAKNDVLGNMLASCQNCNLKKLDRPLIDCVQIFAHDLDTKAAGASHLNTEARTCLLVALQLKHELFHNMVIWVSSFQGRDTKLDSTAWTVNYRAYYIFGKESTYSKEIVEFC